jgi:hypothetical protein
MEEWKDGKGGWLDRSRIFYSCREEETDQFPLGNRIAAGESQIAGSGAAPIGADLPFFHFPIILSKLGAHDVQTRLVIRDSGHLAFLFRLCGT